MNITELSSYQWAIISLCGVMIGMSKTGVKGLSMIFVPVLAYVFGGKLSTGFLLPLLIIADIFAVAYYKRDADWKYIWKLLPFALIGIAGGFIFGKDINDDVFKIVMAGLIGISLVILVIKEIGWISDKSSNSIALSAAFGMLGGFATMMNAAGPIFAIYLLLMRLPKNKFIGTSAWFFLIINISKLPYHIFYWETISEESLMTNIFVVPSIAIGAVAGYFLVKLIPDKPYRWFIIVITLISTLALAF